MGLGDDVMATAYAEMVRKQHPDAKVVFGDPQRFHDPVTNKLNIHWADVFANHPDILQPGEAAEKLVCVDDFPGHRLYVDYEKCEQDGGRILKFAFQKDFSAPRGQIVFSPLEQHAWRAQARALHETIVLEPNVKGNISGQNKAWAWERWQEVADYLSNSGMLVAQFSYEGVQLLKSVEPIETRSFREAAFYLDHARLVVTTDGGLHHAAGALGRPAVVLWSAYSDPQTLGYSDHTNLRRTDEPGNGRLTPCKDCAASMDAITVGMVTAAIETALV